MRLPCWNFTEGAFAVFGCLGTLKCCGLIGLPAAALLLAILFPACVAAGVCPRLPPSFFSPPFSACLLSSVWFFFSFLPSVAARYVLPCFFLPLFETF